MFECLLSVIIPVYNVEPYLEQCLDSVINQTYKNIEIICINDGSTDNSLKILEKYKTKDSRIKIISQKNKGLSEARNAGIKIAKGKYIGFIDPDDFIEPTMYEKLITPMIKDPSIDFSFTNFKYVSEKGVYEGRSIPMDVGVPGKNKVSLSLSELYQIVVWNKVYKRSIIQTNKIYFPAGLYHEDLSFTPSYLVNSQYAYNIPERLYYYRLRRNSICGSENTTAVS